MNTLFWTGEVVLGENQQYRLLVEASVDCTKRLEALPFVSSVTHIRDHEYWVYLTRRHDRHESLVVLRSELNKWHEGDEV